MVEFYELAIRDQMIERKVIGFTSQYDSIL